MKKIGEILAVLGAGFLSLALGARPLPIVDVKTFANPDFEGLSPYIFDLAGEWKFHWSGSEERVPARFEATDYDSSKWVTIAVPASSEALGWGSREVMAKSVSLYRRSFDLPQIWAGRKIYLELEGVRGEAEVWVNGRKLEQVTSGVWSVTGKASYRVTNELAIKVVRTSGKGESGLCGSVRLFSAPKIELRDFTVTLNQGVDARTAEIEVTSEIFKPLGDVSVSGIRGVVDCVAKVFDERGEEIAASSIERVKLSTDSSTTTVKRKIAVSLPRLWTDEVPVIYTVAVQVDHDLRARRVALVDAEKRARSVMRPLSVSATDFRGGAAASKEEIAQCLATLKASNFNAVIGEGELPVNMAQSCDEYGVYVLTNEVEGVRAYRELGNKDSAIFEAEKQGNSPLSLVCTNAASAWAVLENHHTTLETSEYFARWSFTRDGKELKRGTFELPTIAPGQSAWVELPQPDPETTDFSGECLYNLGFVRRDGSEVMRAQLPYEVAVEKSEEKRDENDAERSVSMKTNGKTGNLEVKAGKTSAVFDCRAGKMLSLVMNGREILSADRKLGYCVEGLNAERARVIKVAIGDETITTTDEIIGDGTAGYERKLRWRFFADGKVDLEYEITPFGGAERAAHVLGLTWEAKTHKGLKVRYYGRGPWAHDLKTGKAAPIAIYSASLAELKGMRTDVRRFSVVGADESGIEVSADKPMDVDFGENLKIFAGEKGTLKLRPAESENKAKRSRWFF